MIRNLISPTLINLASGVHRGGFRISDFAQFFFFWVAKSFKIAVTYSCIYVLMDLFLGKNLSEIKNYFWHLDFVMDLLL